MHVGAEACLRLTMRLVPTERNPSVFLLKNHRESQGCGRPLPVFGDFQHHPGLFSSRHFRRFLDVVGLVGLRAWRRFFPLFGRHRYPVFLRAGCHPVRRTRRNPDLGAVLRLCASVLWQSVGCHLVADTAYFPQAEGQALPLQVQELRSRHRGHFRRISLSFLRRSTISDGPQTEITFPR